MLGEKYPKTVSFITGGKLLQKICFASQFPFYTQTTTVIMAYFEAKTLFQINRQLWVKTSRSTTVTDGQTFLKFPEISTPIICHTQIKVIAMAILINLLVMGLPWNFSVIVSFSRNVLNNQISEKYKSAPIFLPTSVCTYYYRVKNQIFDSLANSRKDSLTFQTIF